MRPSGGQIEYHTGSGSAGSQKNKAEKYKADRHRNMAETGSMRDIYRYIPITGRWKYATVHT